MKTRRGSGTIDLLPWLLVAMSLLLGQPASAADSAVRQQAISLNAGQSQVIENLDPDYQTGDPGDPESARAGGPQRGSLQAGAARRRSGQVGHLGQAQGWRGCDLQHQRQRDPKLVRAVEARHPRRPRSSDESSPALGAGCGSMPAAAAPRWTAEPARSSKPTTETITDERARPTPRPHGESRAYVPGTGNDLTATDPNEPAKMGEPLPAPVGSERQFGDPEPDRFRIDHAEAASSPAIPR